MHGRGRDEQVRTFTAVHRRSIPLSARPIQYTHVVVKSAMQQAVQWHLMLENPADGLKVAQQPRNKMRALLR